MAGLSLDGLHCHYQPVVDLERRTVVGYEALCRGAQGTPVEPPLELFAAARREGRVVEVDWACRRAALRGALDAGICPPLKLFVNIEPAAIAQEAPDEVAELSAAALRDMDLVVEFTERAIAEDPAQLLRAINRVRQLGGTVAIDDVGPAPGPLAIVPLARPDVVKLDLEITQRPTDRESAEVAAAIGAYAEASGAGVVAEGIEREEHVDAALALGATLGQGFLFGRPGPLPDPLPSPRVQVPIGGVPPRAPASSPTALVARRLPLRRGNEELVARLAGQLLAQAGELGEHAVVGASVAVRPAAPMLIERLGPLAHNAALVGVIGTNVMLPGAHLGSVESEDPLNREWNLAVLGPYSGPSWPG